MKLVGSAYTATLLPDRFGGLLEVQGDMSLAAQDSAFLMMDTLAQKAGRGVSNIRRMRATDHPTRDT